MSNALLVTGEESDDRPPARRDRSADRLLRAAAAHRAGAERPGHQGPRRLVRRHPPLRPARPRRRLRLVGDQRRQRQHRHRRRAAVQHRRHPRRRSSRRLPGRREVRPDGQSDVHEETATPNLAAPGPAEDLRFEVLRTRHGIVQLRTTVGGKPGRDRDPALHVRPRGRLGGRLRPAQRPGFVHDASRSSGPRATSTTRSTGSTPTRRTSPTTPPGCCRSARRRSTPTCRTGPARSTTGRAGCRSRGTRTRPTRSVATWSAGTTSRRPASRPPTTPGATARSTARWRSRSGCCPRSGARRRSTCPEWSA